MLQQCHVKCWLALSFLFDNFFAQKFNIIKLLDFDKCHLSLFLSTEPWKGCEISLSEGERQLLNLTESDFLVSHYYRLYFLCVLAFVWKV